MKQMKQSLYGVGLAVAMCAIGLVSSFAAEAAVLTEAKPAFCRGNTVPQEFDGRVGLTVKSARIRPGQYVYWRVFNGTDKPIGLGVARLQRYLGGRWVNVLPSGNGDPGAPTKPTPDRPVIPRDSTSACSSSRISSSQQVGRYRLTQEIYIDLRAGGKPIKRTAEFRVVAQLNKNRSA
jgi:hypothetical protein